MSRHLRLAALIVALYGLLIVALYGFLVWSMVTPVFPQVGEQKPYQGANAIDLLNEGQIPKLEFLGSLGCVSACTSTGALQIPPRDVLFIVMKITGYTGADIESLRFNGDAGNNYWWRHLESAAAASTFVNTESAAATNICQLAATGITGGRISTVWILNKPTLSKRATILTGNITGAAGTRGVINIGGCEWVNTTSAITSIELRNAGANSFMADTEFGVFGRNL